MTEPESTEQIREDIEHVRAELGSTVEDLAGRENLSARLREKRAAIATAVRKRTPQPVARAAAVVRRHPTPFALSGGLAAGVVIGRIAGGPAKRVSLRREPLPPQLSGRLAKVAQVTAFVLSGTAGALNGTADALARRVPAKNPRRRGRR